MGPVLVKFTQPPSTDNHPAVSVGALGLVDERGGGGDFGLSTVFLLALQASTDTCWHCRHRQHHPLPYHRACWQLMRRYSGVCQPSALTGLVFMSAFISASSCPALPELGLLNQ